MCVYVCVIYMNFTPYFTCILPETEIMLFLFLLWQINKDIFKKTEMRGDVFSFKWRNDEICIIHKWINYILIKELVLLWVCECVWFTERHTDRPTLESKCISLTVNLTYLVFHCVVSHYYSARVIGSEPQSLFIYIIFFSLGHTSDDVIFVLFVFIACLQRHRSTSSE